MKVLHLNTYSFDYNKSFPHYQFHQGLIDDGHTSWIVSAKGDLNEDCVVILEKYRKIPFFVSRYARWFIFKLLNRNKRYYFYPEWNLDGIKKNEITERLPFIPDVIVTYWTKFAFNQKLVYKLSRHYNAPVLMVIVDMGNLTGGCHFSGDCLNYTRSCGKCHVLKSSRDRDLSRKTWLFKKKYIEMTNISVLACSTLLLQQANSSSLTRDLRKYAMFYSVDEEVFTPEGKPEARMKFNIPKGKKVIFFGAANLNHPRKGIGYLIEALRVLSLHTKKKYCNEDIVVLIAGNKLEGVDFPFEYNHVGYLKTERELSDAYRACDVFACPSVEDSAPIMINQALMSGRPVVAFNTSVAPDIIRDRETGYIAKLKDSKEFANGLNEALNLSCQEMAAISASCRRFAVDSFSKKLNRKRLVKILSKVMEDAS